MQGSADKAGQKGSEHLFVGVEKLIGTRIVLSGYTTFASSTTATVVLPQNLPGVWSSTFDGSVNASDYLVFVVPFNDSTHTYDVTAMSTVASGSDTVGAQDFTITASASSTKTVFWMIVRHSSASVTSFPTHN